MPDKSIHTCNSIQIGTYEYSKEHPSSLQKLILSQILILESSRRALKRGSYGRPNRSGPQMENDQLIAKN